jgi:hypothetical protein
MALGVVDEPRARCERPQALVALGVRRSGDRDDDDDEEDRGERSADD